MGKALNYLKFLSVFIILELAITFITSLLNLLGISSGITALLLFVSNIIIFFVLSFKNAILAKKNGYLEGLILGIIFIFTIFLIKVVLFNFEITIASIIYYLILLIISIVAGMFGANKKSEK